MQEQNRRIESLEGKLIKPGADCDSRGSLDQSTQKRGSKMIIPGSIQLPDLRIGRYWSIELVVPLDITGASFRLQIRTGPDRKETLIVEPDLLAVSVSSSSSTISATVTEQQSNAIPRTLSRGYYELVIKDSLGHNATYATGPISIILDGSESPA